MVSRIDRTCSDYTSYYLIVLHFLDEAGPSKKVKKSPKNMTELDVVLDVFQGFVSEYK